MTGKWHMGGIIADDYRLLFIAFVQDLKRLIVIILPMYSDCRWKINAGFEPVR